MARYTGPSCKLCRRERMKLFLKGDRCESAKCAMENRAYPPGAHPWRRAKTSEYGLQLREKQKVKRFYGVLERQFRKCFRKVSQKTGDTGADLLIMLESRLDNVVFLAGFALSRAHARQMISHGLIFVNGRRTDIPSCEVRLGDEITARKVARVVNLVKGHAEQTRQRERPNWLAVT